MLINNASIVNKNAPLWRVTVQEFENVMNINVNGVVNVIREFVPAMVARKEGMIINMSSSWGSISTPMLYSYAPQYVNESPTPEMWSRHAIQYILNITIDKNGASLTCPQCM